MAQALPVQRSAQCVDFHTYAVDLGDTAYTDDLNNPSEWQSLRYLLQTALDQHCYEIHIEPDTNCLRLRYLILGTFQEIRLSPNDELAESVSWLVSQIPSLQDQEPSRQGWFIFPLNQDRYIYQIDLTVTSWGDSYVISRLCTHQHPVPDLDKIIAQPTQLRQTRTLLHARSGLILVVGSEPHHVTTSLRAMALALVSPERKIVMAETSVHPRIPRTTQIALPITPDQQKQQTFIRACQLSANVIVAADTVLPSEILKPFASSDSLLIHGVITSSASKGLAKLLAAGLQPEAIANSLLSVVVQHRIARLCRSCHMPYRLTETESSWLAAYTPVRENAINDWLKDRLKDRFATGKGCDSCRGTGIADLMTVLEIIEPENQTRDALYRGNVQIALNQLAQQQQASANLLSLARRGIIPLSEAIRIKAEK